MGKRKYKNIMIEKECKVCGKKFTEIEKWKPRIFCSMVCQRKNYYKDNRQKVLDTNKRWYDKKKIKKGDASSNIYLQS